MKKVIMLLFFIMLTSVTACSESPEKLYGFYKSYNEEHHDSWGRIETLSITQDKIHASSWDHNKNILKCFQENDWWIMETKGLYGKKNIKFKTINNEFIELIDNDKKPARKFIKITEEEYKKLQEKPRIPMPSLFD